MQGGGELNRVKDHTHKKRRGGKERSELNGRMQPGNRESGHSRENLEIRQQRGNGKRTIMRVEGEG